MKYELWYSESECWGVLLCEGDMSSLKGPGARVIWTVEANTYKEAAQKRDEFLERTGTEFVSSRDHDGLQKFFASDAYKRERSKRSTSREPTTRVTSVVYLDGDGNQRSVDVPGWVAITPDLVALLAEAETGFSMIMGPIYFERPYSDLTSAPDEITVVDLHSYDGTSRMVQEFSGHIHDKAQLNELISQRLRPNVPHWRIVQSFFLRRSSGVRGTSPISQEMLSGEVQKRQELQTAIEPSRRQEVLAALGILAKADENIANQRKQACPCGSGKAFGECHGSE